MKFIEPDWPAPKHIHAFTTTRQGWGESVQAPLGQNSQETQQLIHLFNLPNTPSWLIQQHTNVVLEAIPKNFQSIGDASYSLQKNQVCVVLTADCLPLLITDTRGTKVAAIHAGWRGLAANIIKATLEQLNHAPQDLLVWFGPAISAEHFEVGSDVYEIFTKNNPLNIRAFEPCGTKKWLADLYMLATIQLHQLGVYQLYGGNFCTFRDQQLFFSYRRDHKNTGRMASLIWIA